MPGMHRALVKSAAAANMNLLRIWGGGVYIYEEFTDACDEEGVMVYEDMMYGTDGIMPGEQWMLSHSSIRAMRAVSLLVRCLCCTATWRLWGGVPGATATSDQEAELRYQIRRQAHHPAIIGWCGSTWSRAEGFSLRIARSRLRWASTLVDARLSRVAVGEAAALRHDDGSSPGPPLPRSQ